MKRLLFFSLFLVLATNLEAQQSFERAETDIGNFGLSITNYGTIGYPDVRDDVDEVSMRYPLGSGTEHLFEGGIWIGALFNNSQLRVSTSSVTTPGGYSRGAAGFEFTADDLILRRSNITEDEFFSSDAVSQQDFIALFTDRRRDINGTPINNHDTPLYADVRLESYNWGFPFTENFSILRYDIVNNSAEYAGAATWDSVFVGMYADLVTRNVISATAQGGEFFNKNGLGYLDSLYTTYVFDAGSDDDPMINTYGAISIIGAEYRGNFFHPSNKEYLEEQGVRAPVVDPSYWLFSAGTGVYDSPNNDIDRYTRMSTIFPLDSTRSGASEPIREELRSDGTEGGGNYITSISIGPFPTVEPGDTITVYVAYSAAIKGSGPEDETFQGTDIATKSIDNDSSRAHLVSTIEAVNRVFQGEDKNNNGVLDPDEDTDGNGELTRYLFPTPPDNPKVRVELEAGKVTLYWDRRAESSVDRVTGEMDFEGYRVYNSTLGDDSDGNVTPRLIREFDIPGNDLGFNTGFDEVALNEPVTFDGDTSEYWYRYEIESLLSGWQYELSVTAFDGGSDVFDVEALESSTNANAVRVFPGTPANENFGNKAREYKVGVYPNPYRVNAAWDGNLESERKLYFYNLPAESEIRIYTVAGDIVGEFTHDADTYQGDISWFESFSDSPRVLAGGEHAWDIQSEANQILTTGLYLFTVKDLNSGEIQTGKLVIIK